MNGTYMMKLDDDDDGVRDDRKNMRINSLSYATSRFHLRLVESPLDPPWQRPTRIPNTRIIERFFCSCLGKLDFHSNFSTAMKWQHAIMIECDHLVRIMLTRI